jgi:phage-related baseplate assembly protein
VPDPATSAIDLSRLPAPTVVEQLSYEAVLAAIVADLQLALPEFDATVESDPAVKLLQVFAWRELLIRAQFNDRARQVMLAYATGSNLDQLGALVNVERLLLDEGDAGLGIAPTYESDADFRFRIQLAPESFSVAGPATASVFHARSADATIADASCTSPVPGEVLVSIMSRLGNGTASADQIEAVEEALNDGVRPLTDLVTVASATPVNYQIEAKLALPSGPDQLVLLERAQANAAAYVAAARRLGFAINRAMIIARLGVEGVLNVQLTKPAADVAISPVQFGNCVGISITVADA